LLAPGVANLLQLALSRTREFDADLDAVQLTNDPAALARALVKIEQASGRWWSFLLPARRSTDPSWIRTHPSTEERVRRLNALAADADRQLALPSQPVSIAPQYHIIVTPARWHGFGVWY
jgi:heat shock protein HtpX